LRLKRPDGPDSTRRAASGPQSRRRTRKLPQAPSSAHCRVEGVAPQLIGPGAAVGRVGKDVVMRATADGHVGRPRVVAQAGLLAVAPPSMKQRRAEWSTRRHHRRVATRRPRCDSRSGEGDGPAPVGERVEAAVGGRPGRRRGAPAAWFFLGPWLVVDAARAPPRCLAAGPSRGRTSRTTRQSRRRPPALGEGLAGPLGGGEQGEAFISGMKPRVAWRSR